MLRIWEYLVVRSGKTRQEFMKAKMKMCEWSAVIQSSNFWPLACTLEEA